MTKKELLVLNGMFLDKFHFALNAMMLNEIGIKEMENRESVSVLTMEGYEAWKSLYELMENLGLNVAEYNFDDCCYVPLISYFKTRNNRVDQKIYYLA